MKLLIDTNVVLDVLLKREPYFDASRKVLELAGNQNIQEYVSASSITDIYYIVHRQTKSKDTARELIKKLLMIVSVAGVAEREIRTALNLDWTDFEDSVQYAIATLNFYDGVVTRNASDYKKSKIKIWEPVGLLAEIE